MLDGKILAAVLATLAAFGVAGGSQADGFNPTDKLQIPSMSDLNPRSLGAFTGLIPEDTSTSKVEATLKYNNSLSQQATVSSDYLEIANLSSINTKSQTVKSDGNMSLEQFDGGILVSRESRINGQTGSILSSGVNVSGGFKVDETLETSRIKAVRVSGSDMTFEEVSGSVDSGSTSADLASSGTSVKVDSFNGNITFRPLKGEIELIGEVSEFEAGDVSIG